MPLYRVETSEYGYDPFGEEYIGELGSKQFQADLTEITLDLDTTNPNALINTSADYEPVLAERFVHRCIGNAAVRAAKTVLGNPQAISTFTKWRDKLLLSEDEQIPPNPTLEQVNEKMLKKFRRNTALGTLETFMCLDGITRRAWQYTQTEKRQNENYRDMVHLSHAMVIGLAGLPDDVETERIYGLAGVTETDLKFHNYQVGNVLDGTLAIPTDKFVVVGAPGRKRVICPEALSPTDQRLEAQGCPLNRIDLPPEEGRGKIMKVHWRVCAAFFLDLTSYRYAQQEKIGMASSEAMPAAISR
jgi:hypothetical protein